MLGIRMAKMKSVARSFSWWPGMNTEIEGLAKKCELHLQSRGLPPASIVMVECTLVQDSS